MDFLGVAAALEDGRLVDLVLLVLFAVGVSHGDVHVTLLGQFVAYLADTQVFGCEFTGILVGTDMATLALAAYSTCLGTSVCVVLRIVPVCGAYTHLLILLRILGLLVT